MKQLNQGWTYRDRVRAVDAGLTLLAYYSQRYRHSTADQWRDRILAGQIQIDDRPATPETVLAAGQHLAYHRPPWAEPAVPLKFQILYEDADCLAIAKPSGLPVLPGGGFLQHTLWWQLQQRYPENPPVPVHRLGRGTSGLLLLARSERARDRLSRQFRDGAARGDNRNFPLRKVYRALVGSCKTKDSGYESAFEGTGFERGRAPLELSPTGGETLPQTPPIWGARGKKVIFEGVIGREAFRNWHDHSSDLPDTFRIDSPIGPVPHPTLGNFHAANPNGRPARSDVKVLQRRAASTLLEVRIYTGRPHQIRIHLATIGVPLLGDPFYIPGGQFRLQPVSPEGKLPVPGDCGYWLHAHQLSCWHPCGDRPLHLECPPPPELCCR